MEKKPDRYKHPHNRPRPPEPLQPCLLPAEHISNLLITGNIWVAIYLESPEPEELAIELAYHSSLSNIFLRLTIVAARVNIKMPTAPHSSKPLLPSGAMLYPRDSAQNT